MVDPAIRQPENDDASVPTVGAASFPHVPEPTDVTTVRDPNQTLPRVPPLVMDYRLSSALPGPETARWALPSIPGYEIEGVLGRGGMGIVYRARQVMLNRIVALKMILAGEHAGHEASVRFLSEAEMVAKLRHPHIVQIYGFGAHDDRPYLELEYLEGGSLAQRLDGTPWPPAQAAGLLETLARAIDQAHQREIIHRDLKPANILLAADGTPKITDFGLAKSMRAHPDLTHSGAIMGSPSYMAPEQAEGKTRETGPAADLYSLGVILYELLTGRPPFRGSTVYATLHQVKTAEPVPPARLVPGLPRDIETIAIKCLRKDPGKRYGSALALAEDLARFQARETILARPPSVPERGWRWCRRNQPLAWSFGAVAAALLALAGLSLLYASQQAHFAEKQDEARKEADLQLAISDFERGEALCEKGDVGTGLLRLIASWQAAREAEEPPWQNLARASLSSWQREYAGPRAVFSHQARVALVAFSPDGQTIITCGGDHRARLWDAATGRPCCLPLEHQGPVTAAAFSPDGKTVLTGSFDATARFWDVPSGRPKGAPLKHANTVFSVAYSPDGKTVLTGSWDHTAQLWDSSTGKPLGPPLQHQEWVWGVAFSPDGKTVITGSWDGTGRLWDVLTGQPKGDPLRHGSLVSAVAFGPDGKTVATASFDSSARIWDAVTGQPVGAPLQHRHYAVPPH